MESSACEAVFVQQRGRADSIRADIIGNNSTLSANQIWKTQSGIHPPLEALQQTLFKT